jgi:hypothetical protein
MFPLTGEMTLTLEDGRVIEANSLIALARKWAEAMHGDAWKELSFTEQSYEVADAYSELREKSEQAAGD